jgi:hypothetical protein
MEPQAKTCARAVALGRALRAVFRVGPRAAAVVYGVYGYAGGHCEPAKAKRTDAIIGAIRDEIVAMGDTHVILAGDLNANP